VPLVKRASVLWREAEAAHGERLLFTTGSFESGPENGVLFSRSLASCIEYGLEHKVLSAREAMDRYPVFRLPADHRVLLQPDGGFIASERAITAHVALAEAHGAMIRAREVVQEWTAIAGGGVLVTTDRGRYDAGQLVIAAGAWVGDLVPGLRGVAVAERQVLGWFQPSVPSSFAPDSFPVSILDAEEGAYYVMPIWGVPGVKAGRHHHRRENDHPDQLSRDVTTDDEAVIRQALARYLPSANGPRVDLTTCIYTNTPDEHFIIDRLPGDRDVIVVSPCSGHGYKFASVVGEIVADLITRGSASFDLRMFRIDRF
jgi:sarcosine oxidase